MTGRLSLKAVLKITQRAESTHTLMVLWPLKGNVCREMEMCKREGCRNVSYLSLFYLHSSWLKNTTGTVAIPTHFYKIITRCDGSKTPYYETPNCQGRLDVISFILPHSAKSICKVSSVFCVIIKIDRYCFTRCMVGYHNLFETTCCVPVVFCTSEEIIVDTRTLKLKARKL